MKIITSKKQLTKLVSKQKNLGFVPTMGAIHIGHISLIKKCIKQSDKTIVTIFVNKPQFNKKNDFLKYPRMLNKDISALSKLKIFINEYFVISATSGDWGTITIPIRLKKHNHTNVVKKYGKACSYPGTFMGSIHALISSSNYKSAVIKTIKAGGCNCSRANFVGAYFAALKGFKNIPPQWIKKTKPIRSITNLL